MTRSMPAISAPATRSPRSTRSCPSAAAAGCRSGATRATSGRAMGDDNGELAFLRLRYKLPGQDRSRLIEQPVARGLICDARGRRTGDTAFAAAVAAYGQLLRGDTNLGDFSFADARALAERRGRRGLLAARVRAAHPPCGTPAVRLGQGLGAERPQILPSFSRGGGLARSAVEGRERRRAFLLKKRSGAVAPPPPPCCAWGPSPAWQGRNWPRSAGGRHDQQHDRKHDPDHASLVRARAGCR